MSDYVINYGKPDQFRASMEIVEVWSDDDHQYVATISRVGTSEKLAQATGSTAGMAHRGALAKLREMYDSIEYYQRLKHRDLSLGKILKK